MDTQRHHFQTVWLWRLGSFSQSTTLIAFTRTGKQIYGVRRFFSCREAMCVWNVSLARRWTRWSQDKWTSSTGNVCRKRRAITKKVLKAEKITIKTNKQTNQTHSCLHARIFRQSGLKHSRHTGRLQLALSVMELSDNKLKMKSPTEFRLDLFLFHRIRNKLQSYIELFDRISSGPVVFHVDSSRCSKYPVLNFTSIMSENVTILN